VGELVNWSRENGGEAGEEEEWGKCKRVGGGREAMGRGRGWRKEQGEGVGVRWLAVERGGEGGQGGGEGGRGGGQEIREWRGEGGEEVGGAEVWMVVEGLAKAQRVGRGCWGEWGGGRREG